MDKLDMATKSNNKLMALALGSSINSFFYQSSKSAAILSSHLYEHKMLWTLIDQNLAYLKLYFFLLSF